ncbi:hypothetical protein, partial [Massilicoli timonensis]|uniref:hypothetical protein n=2 Tax=Massilicoli timonensis TaxID=2015901 RepID=UPI003AAB8046
KNNKHSFFLSAESDKIFTVYLRIYNFYPKNSRAGNIFCTLQTAENMLLLPFFFSLGIVFFKHKY